MFSVAVVTFTTLAAATAAVQQTATHGASLMQTSAKANLGVFVELAEDPFGDLEDSFDIPPAASKDPFGDFEDSFDIPASASKSLTRSSFASAGSVLGGASFWTSCVQDIVVFALVLLLVPLFTGKLLQKRSGNALKVADNQPQPETRTHQPPQSHAVNFGLLMRAARFGEDAQWQSLLQAIPNVAHAEDRFGCTALHVAVDASCVEMAATLLEQGADANAKDTWEETPLHFAARKGNVEVCELLLAKGAELDAVNSQDVTPLVAAAKAGKEATCQLLLDRGASCGGISEEDVLPLLSTLLMYKMILPQRSSAEQANSSEEDDDEES